MRAGTRGSQPKAFTERQLKSSSLTAYSLLPTVYFYHTDHLGSPRIITNLAGEKVAEYEYLPFGFQKEGPRTVTPFAFTGKPKDEESGLQYFGNRFYTCLDRRFVSTDKGRLNLQTLNNPQKWNLYIYCSNNPIRLFDPNGLDEQEHMLYKLCPQFVEYGYQAVHAIRLEQTKNVAVRLVGKFRIIEGSRGAWVSGTRYTSIGYTKAVVKRTLPRAVGGGVIIGAVTEPVINKLTGVEEPLDLAIAKGAVKGGIAGIGTVVGAGFTALLFSNPVTITIGGITVGILFAIGAEHYIDPIFEWWYKESETESGALHPWVVDKTSVFIPPEYYYQETVIKALKKEYHGK